MKNNRVSVQKERYQSIMDEHKSNKRGGMRFVLIWTVIGLFFAAGPGCSKRGEDIDLEDAAVDAVVDTDGPLTDGMIQDRDLFHDDGSPIHDDGTVDLDAEVETPYVVYMTTTGDDSLDGLTPSTAVATLQRVHEILSSQTPDQDVEVRIEQGTYSGHTIIWTYYNPSRSIKFMPIDYHGGGIDSIAGRPVFDGQGAPYMFRLHVTDGQPTNMEFIYLRFERYQQYALHFLGNRNNFDTGWNGSNRVFGCYFYDIGNLASPGNPGYGAVDLVNSIENTITNNHFVKNENIPSQAGLMHSVYLAHGSRWNDIHNNRFQTVSGDPIRVRDYSNFNDFRGNVFTDAGSSAFISDWWCDMSANPNCTKEGGECPSWENEFRNNELHCGYSGDISVFRYFQGETYVPDWCDDHFTDGWARLYTSSNTKTCP